MNSSCPISALDRPRVMSRNTSISRVVKVSTAFGGACRWRRGEGWIPRLGVGGGRGGGPAASNGCHGGARRLGRVFLGDEAAGAGSQRLVDVVVEIEGGEDQDPRRRI